MPKVTFSKTNTGQDPRMVTVYLDGKEHGLWNNHHAAKSPQSPIRRSTVP